MEGAHARDHAPTRAPFVRGLRRTLSMKTAPRKTPEVGATIEVTEKVGVTRSWCTPMTSMMYDVTQNLPYMVIRVTTCATHGAPDQRRA